MRKRKERKKKGEENGKLSLLFFTFVLSLVVQKRRLKIFFSYYITFFALFIVFLYHSIRVHFSTSSCLNFLLFLDFFLLHWDFTRICGFWIFRVRLGRRK